MAFSVVCELVLLKWEGFNQIKEEIQWTLEIVKGGQIGRCRMKSHKTEKHFGEGHYCTVPECKNECYYM